VDHDDLDVEEDPSIDKARAILPNRSTPSGFSEGGTLYPWIPFVVRKSGFLDGGSLPRKLRIAEMGTAPLPLEHLRTGGRDAAADSDLF
jgi:hypothetical protein